MRQAATRRPLLTGIAIGVLAGAVWWVVAEGGGTRLEPAPGGAERDDAERERSGDAPPAGELPAPVPAADRSLDVEPTRGAATRTLLRGFVVDRAGAKVEGAVIAWGDDGARPSTRNFQRRLTASGGEYAIGGLPPSVVHFRVTATGCTPHEVALDVARGGALRHDFVLDRSAMVAVRVRRPDGTAIGNEPSADLPRELFGSFAVVATDEPIATLAPISSRSVSGVGVGALHRNIAPGRRNARVEIPEGAFGVLELPRLPLEATLLFKHVVIDRQRIATAGADVTFTLDPAKVDLWTSVLRLKLVDAASGEPIKDASVGVYDTQTGGQGRRIQDDGTFEQRRIPPGWMGVTINSTSHAAWRRNLLFQPGATIDLGVVSLPAGISLSGTLVDADGKPPAEALIAAWPLDTYVPGQPFGMNAYWGLEKPGEWSVQQLAPGRHQIGAQIDTPDHSNHRAWQVVDVVDSPPPLALTLRPTVKVLVEASGKASRGTPPDPTSQWTADLVRSDGFVVNAALRFRIGPAEFALLPGSYIYSVRADSIVQRTVPFDVGEQPLHVRFALDDDEPPVITVVEPTAAAPAATDVVTVAAQLPTAATSDEPGIALHGRIVDEADAAVEGARVTAVDSDGKRLAASIAPDGAFVVAGVRPGRIELQGSADSFKPAGSVVELVAGAEPPAVKLLLRRMTRVKVTLEDPSGTPLYQAYERHFRGRGSFDADFTVVAARAPAPDRWPCSSFSRGLWIPGGDSSPGALDLREPPPLVACVVFAERVVASLPIEPDTKELRFVIDPALLDAHLATLRFRLVDALSGAPITRAFAGLCSTNSMLGRGGATDPEWPDGVVVIEGTLPGRRLLCLATSNGASLQFLVDLPAGGTLDLGEVELLEPVELHGVIVDEAGQPVATSLRTVAYDVHGAPEFDGTHSRVDSDKQGRFKFRTALPRLRLQHDGDSTEYALAPLHVDAASASESDAELRFVLRRGQIVTLRPRPGDDRLCRLALHASNGELLRRSQNDGSYSSRLRLLPGDYRLVVERDGADAKEIAFSVGDAPVTVELP